VKVFVYWTVAWKVYNIEFILLKLASLTDFMLYCIIFTICCVGLDTQIQEIKESVELPLTHPEYYEEMGIKPPKGVILYGPPGTGKTLLAKAVANQTSATFLRVVGSELIQKYLVSLCVTSHFKCYFGTGYGQIVH
jgi:hypothetical protein